MDLGIAGKRALICASSKGLGKGCAVALAEAGCSVVLNARGAEALEATAAEIRALGADVTAVAADITTDDGRAEVLEAAGPTDILVNNAGGPPPGMWTDWEREDFIAALDSNMLTPIAMMKALLPGMIERGWGRVVNITSVSVKAPVAQLGLSNSARAGLTGYVAGTARQVAQHGVIINNLLPGDFDTERHQSNTRVLAEKQNKTYEEMRAIRIGLVAAGRFGDPAEFGDYCAYLCSAQASFITGQNLLIDGGKYPGTF